MTISQISVWNRALGFLGTRSVASEQENTPEALQCRLYWDSARRQVLRDFPWSFAQRRAWMALVPLPEGFAPEFRFAYALPDDCLKVHEVRHEGITARPFCLAQNAAGDGSLLEEIRTSAAGYSRIFLPARLNQSDLRKLYEL